MLRVFRFLLITSIILLNTNILLGQWIKTPGLEGYFTKCFVTSDTNFFAGTVKNGVFLSTDKGITWIQANDGLPQVGISSLVIKGQTIYAGVNGSGIFLSTDNKINWSRSDTGITSNNINALFVNGSDLFVALNRGVCTSNDDGKNWAICGTWPLPLLTSPYVLSFAAIGSNVFSGTFGDGVFRLSSDKKWTSVSTGLTNKYINCLCANGSKLFAGTNDGVYVSYDNGANWGAVNNGLTNKHIHTIITINSSTLFAGTDEGVVLSTNNGTNWTSTNMGFPNTMVYSLLVFNSNVFAGTETGVWQRPLSEMITNIENEQHILPIEYFLSQNYPNPFNPNTTINYCIANPGLVTVRILNILGEEIGQLVNEYKNTGSYSVNFDASKFSSGIYFYSLSSGSFVQTKKMIVLK